MADLFEQIECDDIAFSASVSNRIDNKKIPILSGRKFGRNFVNKTPAIEPLRFESRLNR